MAETNNDKDGQLVLFKETKNGRQEMLSAESFNDLVRRIREIDGRKLFSAQNGTATLSVAKAETTYRDVL